MFLLLKKYTLAFTNEKLPVLIDKEADIQVDDRFYLESGEIRICKDRFYTLGYDVIVDDMDSLHLFDLVHKVVVMPEGFGYSINYGPPHDRNWDWKFDEDSKRYVYLEDFHPDTLEKFKEGDQVIVVVEEICPHYGGKHIGKDCSCKSGFIIRPRLFRGKIIMDGYKLLEAENEGNYFH
jgi:hypothetical protein